MLSCQKFVYNLKIEKSSKCDSLPLIMSHIIHCIMIKIEKKVQGRTLLIIIIMYITHLYAALNAFIYHSLIDFKSIISLEKNKQTTIHFKYFPDHRDIDKSVKISTSLLMSVVYYIPFHVIEGR